MNKKNYEIKEKKINIKTEDGVSSIVTLFSSSAENNSPVIVCFPAMGVNSKYYHPLARSLCDRGFNAVTVDLRGIGDSSIRASRKVNFGYYEMIHYDWPAIMNTVKKAFPDNSIYLLGHSLGGQLSSLYISYQEEHDLKGLILLAVNSVYHRSFPFPGWLIVLFGTQLANLIAKIFGFLPGDKLGFAGIEARNVIKDWSYQGRTGKYKILNSSLDYEALLSEVQIPILALTIENDFLAPQGAVKHLYQKMKLSDVEHVHLEPKDLNLEKRGTFSEHFSWIKRPEVITDKISKWISNIK